MTISNLKRQERLKPRVEKKKRVNKTKNNISLTFTYISILKNTMNKKHYNKP